VLLVVDETRYHWKANFKCDLEDIWVASKDLGHGLWELTGSLTQWAVVIVGHMTNNR
jgi:hypothetical protein